MKIITLLPLKILLILSLNIDAERIPGGFTPYSLTQKNN
jgi:hypothetical protein